METDASPPFNLTDLLLSLGLFACFVVFGICMWLLRRERDKKKAAGQKDATK